MEGDDGKSFLAQGPGNWPPRPSVMSGGRNAANTVTIQPSWLSRDGGDALRGNKLRSTTGMGGTGRGDMADAASSAESTGASAAPSSTRVSENTTCLVILAVPEAPEAHAKRLKCNTRFGGTLRSAKFLVADTTLPQQSHW